MTIAEELNQYYKEKEQSMYSLMELAILINKVHIENGNFIINKVKVPKDVYQNAINIIIAGGEFSAVCNSIDNILSEHINYFNNVMTNRDQIKYRIIIYDHLGLIRY